jgi:hypothetical protein
LQPPFFGPSPRCPPWRHGETLTRPAGGPPSPLLLPPLPPALVVVAAGLVSKGGGGLWPRRRDGASDSGGGGPRWAATALGVAAARAVLVGAGGEVGDDTMADGSVAWRRDGGGCSGLAGRWASRARAGQRRLWSSSSCVLGGARWSLAVVAPERRSGGFGQR